MSRLLKNIYSKEFYNNFSEILGEVVVGFTIVKKVESHELFFAFAGNFNMEKEKEMIMEFFTKFR